jgi:hypothetical protein
LNLDMAIIMSYSVGEVEPLLQNEEQSRQRNDRAPLTRLIVWAGTTTLFVFGLILVFAFPDLLAQVPGSGALPKDPLAAAYKVLQAAPIIVRILL